jgi:hypothetical protein
MVLRSVRPATRDAYILDWPMWIAARLNELKPLDFAFAVTVAALMATGIFAHANRHGNRHATAWGVATFLFAAVAIPVYFARYWIGRARR